MDDLISRKAAVEKILGQPPEAHYPSWYARQIEDLPPAQPAKVATDINVGTKDTISRKAAIDGKICIQRANGVEIYDDYVVPVEYLEQLPPAQPEPKRGRWIYKTDLITAPTGYWECSECKEGRLLYEENFCPNCGADMREVTT